MRNTTLWLVTALCALFLVLGCEAIKDAVEDEADTDFEKETEFELAPIAYEDNGGDLSLAGEPCGETSIAAEIAKNEIDLSDVEVSDVSLDFLETRYKNATWTPPSITEVACQLTVNDVLIADQTVTGSSTDWTAVELSEAAKAQVAHFLNPSNWNETFSYCASCAQDPDTFSAQFMINIGATLTGKISID
jgi:hypothetical protein